MKKLQHLMELEKSNYRHEDVPLQKKKPDVRSLSAPNVAMKSLDIKTEVNSKARSLVAFFSFSNVNPCEMNSIYHEQDHRKQER